MSGTLAPTSEQAIVNFAGIDEQTDQQPLKFTPALSKQQYLAGGSYGVDINVVLSRNFDRLRKAKGDKVIEDMLCDPEITKCLTVLKISVLNDGITFSPAVSKPAPIKALAPGETETPEQKQERLTREQDLERFKLAEKYANFATRAIQNIDTPIRTVLENMLDAITYGNQVAEQTYREEFDKEFGKKLLTLDSIRVKPRRAVRFVVDKFNKLLGIATIINVDGESKTVVIPREKFLVLTFRGKNGDPRGESILQAVYNAWYLKMQLWPEYLRWLLQCAIPSLVGYTAPAESTTPTPLRNAVTNELIVDSHGNQVYQSDVDQLLQSLIKLRNASAIALPHGASVTPISNTVSGDPFKGMRDVLNEEIEMGLILQTLATSEGRNMSRAAAQTHMSVLDLLVFFIKGLVIDMIVKDVLIPLMEINFADFDRELLPVVSMGDSERRDWATDVVAIATGWKSGYFSESQKPGLDRIINAPERDVESDRRIADAVASTTPTSVPNTAPTPNPSPNSSNEPTKAERLLEIYAPFDGEQ